MQPSSIHQIHIAQERSLPVTGGIYHVYNRGVEKRKVFCERVDFIRFIHDLFEFNNTFPAPEFSRRYKPGDTYVGRRTSHIGKRLVDIVCFCLMDNHYHLLLRQRVDGGIPLFMKKLGGGYTRAFNDKYERVGPLFQGKYKIQHVGSEEYLRNLVCYVHLNPLKFLKKVNENKKLNFYKTWEALNTYRWSSHLDYLGEDNFGSVVEKRFILGLFGGLNDYKEFAQDWMRNEAEKLEIVLPFAIDLDKD